MRSFQHAQTLDPVPGDVVALLRQIDRAAGAEGRYADQLPQLLGALREQARVESITASSAIEGVVVDDVRIPKLVSGTPGVLRNRSEAEFAGYSSALDYLTVLAGRAGAYNPFNLLVFDGSSLLGLESRHAKVVTLQPGEQRDPLGLWDGAAATDADGNHPRFLPALPAYAAPGVRVYEVVPSPY